MTTIVAKIASIESSSNPNVKTRGSLDVTPEKIVFKPEDQETGDYIIIKYNHVHLFATGNNDEFLLIIAQDLEASDAEDEDGDESSVEYRIFTENVQELYEALQKNQELHPTENINEQEELDGGEMFTADSLQNGDFVNLNGDVQNGEIKPNGENMEDDEHFTDDV
jgi:hypothetical protein